MPEIHVMFYQQADGQAPVVDWLQEMRAKTEIKTTSDALSILDRMAGKSPELRRLTEEARINAAVAQLIFAARIKAGLSQAELAEKLGTKQSVVSRLEDADYEGHSLNMLQRIAAALGQSLEIRFCPRSGQVAAGEPIRRSWNRSVETFRMIFGAHCSTAGGVRTALSRAERIAAECVQIFVKNNMQWLGKPPAPDEAAGFAADRKRAGFKAVFGHAGYLINLGGPPSPNRARSLQSLIQEISFAGALGLPFLVLHPGAHLGAGEERGLELIVAGLDEALAKTKKSGVRLALENTAGQGTCLGHKIEHLAAIFDAVKQPERLGLCLDTAHFFAAGFDLRTGKGWDAAIAQGGKADWPQGNSGLSSQRFQNRPRLARGSSRAHRQGQNWLGRLPPHRQRRALFGAPGCLETPKSEDLHEDMENLATLRALVDQGKRAEKGSLDY